MTASTSSRSMAAANVASSRGGEGLALLGIDTAEHT
jgi:hypothetical protein